MTAVFNCQGPLDAPTFVGSGMVSRKISYSVDVPASSASEAMLKNKESGAVAAFDRVPFSYLSANFTFNTDNCVCFFSIESLVIKMDISLTSVQCSAFVKFLSNVIGC